MNCPNCGAVVKGSECEYCGTTFENKKLNVNIEMKGDTEELVKAFKKTRRQLYVRLLQRR